MHRLRRRRATESSSVRSSGCTTASPPASRICGGDLLAACRHGGRRARPGSRRRPARSAVAAPMPDGGTGDDGRAAAGLGVLLLAISAPAPGRDRGEAAHVERVHARRSGRGRPRPRATRWTRLVSAICASSRARLAPRQKCRPPPKRQDLRELVLVPEDVVVVGAREDPLVAVGRAEAEQQLGALRRDRAVQLDVLEQVAGEHLAGGVEAQRLLDPRVDHRGRRARVRSKTCCELVGVPGQVEERVAEQLGGGLVAGDDHQEQERDDLLVGEPVAVDLGLEQRAGEVVGRPAPALVDHVLVVADQAERGSDAGRRDVVDAVLAVHHEVGLAAYLDAVGLGDAHHLGDDVHRELAGEVGDPVEAAQLEALGEVAVGELAGSAAAGRGRGAG